MKRDCGGGSNFDVTRNFSLVYKNPTTTPHLRQQTGEASSRSSNGRRQKRAGWETRVEVRGCRRKDEEGG